MNADPCGSGSTALEIIIKKKNLPTICPFLFHTTVLQSRIHRPKIINKIFIEVLLSFLLDLELEKIIPDPGKTSGYTTLN